MPLEDLGERPVGDAVAVGEAAAAERGGVRVGRLGPRDELAREPRLPDPRVAVHRDEVGSAVARDAPEDRPQDLELGVAADHRRRQARDAARRRRALLEEAERPHALAPALHRLRSLVFEDEPSYRVRRALRDEHGPRLGQRLEPRRGVDGVAGRHRLAGHGRRHGEDLARVDPECPGSRRGPPTGHGSAAPVLGASAERRAGPWWDRPRGTRGRRRPPSRRRR